MDEFYHASAPTYQRFLNYFKPKILLGLTATPERMDGASILDYFDNRIAAEIRFPEAIDRKMLSPFQYFGVTDTVDLSDLKWARGGYEKSELTNLYSLIREVYGKFSFARLKVWAGVRGDFNEPAEEVLTKAFSRIVAIDSRRWIEFLLDVLPRLLEVRFAELPAVQLRMMRMFYITVWQKYMADFDNEEALQNLMDLADSPVMLVKMLYMWMIVLEKSKKKL